MQDTTIAPGSWVKFIEPQGAASVGDFGIVASWNIGCPVVLLAERSLQDGSAYWQPAPLDVLTPIDEVPPINMEECASYVKQVGLKAALYELKKVATRKVKS
jgi:hypothetical protein